MIWQTIEAGKVVGDTTGATTTSDGSTKTKSGMDDNKEMFLKLLVAEMQYQDPLQPTDNSEYVKELATFTQVETLNSVNEQVEQLQANSMVGKYVSLYDKDTDTSKEGKVDYVTTQEGTTFVSVDGELWEADKVTAVQDPTYFEAHAKADSVVQMINNLPAINRFTIQDADKVTGIGNIISSLDDYTKSLIPDDTMAKFDEASKKANEMAAQAKALAENGLI